MSFIKTLLVRRRGVLLKLVVAIPSLWILLTLVTLDKPEKDASNEIPHNIKRYRDTNNKNNHFVVNSNNNNNINNDNVEPNINDIVNQEEKEEDDVEIRNAHPRKEKVIHPHKENKIKKVEIPEVTQKPKNEEHEVRIFFDVLSQNKILYFYISKSLKNSKSNL